MKRLSLLLAAGFLSSCVDPSGLVGFECDGGRCRMVDAGGSTGGGDATTGGGSAQGGGTGTGGGTQVCNASSCTGCCDETGACRSGDANTACGQTGSACSDCGAGARCAGSICQPLKATGDSCNSGGDCSTSHCVTGVCCNSACTGACQRCDATGTEGTCSALPEATNVTACGAYACDGISGECPTMCTTSRQCATGNYCSNGSCQPLKDKGATCTASVQCTTGFCADGVCCDSACSGSCDRCNQAGALGTCSAAPSGDPGSPACGTITCNGTLVDCPILCGSGCPSGTYCSGTYCSAVKDDGVSCSAAGQCKSGFCADGVCCNSACGGACDSCSAANGATTDGVCSLLGASRICRNATSTCDREERCTGASADCPTNGFVDAGVGCGSTTYTAWSSCDAGASCATSGVQTRTRTEQACNGGNATCTPNTATESQACNRPSEGAVCGTTTFGNWSSCDYGSDCDESASRSRTRTEPRCASGVCQANQANENEACNRSQENVSCGTASFTAWSACAQSATCSLTGTQTRTRTDPVCRSQSCGSATATETQACNVAAQTGASCGTTVYGGWSACSYANPCSTSGVRSRSVTSYACTATGTCGTSTTTENETAPCDRGNPTGECAPTAYGEPTGCAYGDQCTNSGSGTRTVTTYACGGGSCQPSTTNQAATCTRDTSAVVCRTAVNVCDRAENCSGGVCPADTFAPSFVMCRAGNEATCTTDSYCTGSSTTCSIRRACSGTCCGDGTCASGGRLCQ